MISKEQSVRVGTTERGRSATNGDVEEYNLFIQTGTLNSRISRFTGNKILNVTLDWPTSEETYSVKIDKDMEFQSGDQLDVLLSTDNSTSRGYFNAYSRIEAVQTFPGYWVPTLESTEK